MISFKKARELIEKSIYLTGSFSINIDFASCSYISESIISDFDYPFFDRSAMDGYALADLHTSSYKIIGEICAGDKDDPVLNPGEAVRIFTGAPVPSNAVAVVAQENTITENEFLTCSCVLKQGMNIRKRGNQLRKGDVLLEKGSLLNPAAIGHLKSLGIQELSVYGEPSATIITSGNELKAAEETLQRGEIYESNGQMLMELLMANNCDPEHHHVMDDLDSSAQCIQHALQQSDLVLITGGISVGKYDFIREALLREGVEEVFYKISQKPGKPIWFGKKEEKIVFALPGNPAAVLTCFYEYVLPAIRMMQGAANPYLKKCYMPISSDFRKKKGRTEFLKASLNGGEVKVLEMQGSASLASYAVADCLVVLEEDADFIKKGQLVEVHLID